ASTYYASVVNPIATSIFGTKDSINFDNGTDGTYNVNYPDAIAPINGASADMHYSTLDTEYACIHYAGVFNGGTKTGKLVYMSYPFETIYPATSRDTIMKDILIFFFGKQTLFTGIDQSTANTNAITIYPNPNKGEFTIRCSQPVQFPLQIRVFDISGRVIIEESMTEQEKQLNCNSLVAGTYLVGIYNSDVIQSMSRVVIVK
ncbi:MAG TPA: T9SS type A sorting domain-containing protein, partial [Bacteroidia bacterium]|nr:T9SS type A sorting domain-containing protein [Bacteroidia bacterium]